MNEENESLPPAQFAGWRITLRFRPTTCWVAQKIFEVSPIGDTACHGHATIEARRVRHNLRAPSFSTPFGWAADTRVRRPEPWDLCRCSSVGRATGSNSPLGSPVRIRPAAPAVIDGKNSMYGERKKEVRQTNDYDRGFAYLLFLAALCQPDPADVRRKPDPPRAAKYRGKLGRPRHPTSVVYLRI